METARGVVEIKLSNRNVARKTQLNKRAANAEAAWKSSLPRSVRRSIPGAKAGASVVTPLEEKQESNRLAERTRAAKERLTGEQRRIRGFRRSTDDPNAAAFLVEEVPAPRIEQSWSQPTAHDLRMRARLQQFLERTAPFDPDPYTFATDELEVKMRSRRGKVPSDDLEKLRAAYRAVFERDPAERWKDALRGRVEAALRYILAGTPRGKLPAHIAGNGRDILGRLKKSHGSDVPAALTAERINRLLRGSTLARGGGRGGGKKNVERSLEELFAEIEKLKAT